jgi:hypothetical protein
LHNEHLRLRRRCVGARSELEWDEMAVDRVAALPCVAVLLMVAMNLAFAVYLGANSPLG